MGIPLHPEEITRLFKGFLYVLEDATPQAVAVSSAIPPAETPEIVIPQVPVRIEAPAIPQQPVPPVEAKLPPVVQVPVAVPQLVVSIDWKLKAGSKVAFVMRENEFKDRDLTGFLRDQVKATALDTDLVGFGVAAAGIPDWSALPTPFGVGFGLSVPEGSDHIFQVPSLSDARSQPAAHAQLILVLANLRMKLNQR